MPSTINRTSNAVSAPVDSPPLPESRRLGRSMSNPALSSRNAAAEAATGSRPRASMPVSTNASSLSDSGPLQRSASSPALLPVDKFESTSEKLAGLSAPTLKFHASLVMASMDKLTVPAEAAKLGEQLQQKLSVNEGTIEAGAIKHTNSQISALLGELRSRPPQESMETLVKLSDASDKYANAVLNYPPDKLGDGMKLNALKLNIEVQTSYANTGIAVKAKESGQSAETIAARAESMAVGTLSAAGSPPTPETVEASRRLIKGETSPPPR